MVLKGESRVHGRAMMIGMRRVAGFFRGLMGAVSGTAAVEFALFLFFILMPFLFGIFEIGRALEQHHVVTKSVRDAVRYVARRELETGTTEFDEDCAEKGDSGGGLSPAGEAKDLAMYGEFRPATTGATPLMAAWDAAANASAYQTVCITGPVAVNTGTLTVNVVTVTATVPFDDILLQAFGIGPISFDVSHQERYIGE